MKAGDVLNALVKVTNAGVPVLGLTTAAFTVSGYVGTTTFSPSFSAVEIGTGWYRLDITTSGTAGWQTYTATCTGYQITPDYFAGALELYDDTSIYAAVIRPGATLASSAVIATALVLDVIANRYTPISVSVTDQNGLAVDLSGYNNWRFTVWDKLHANTKYTLSSGITGSAGGVVAWAIPENASFFAWIDAVIAASSDSLVVYYDMVADMAATASESRTVFRGTINLWRYEAVA